MYTLFAQAFTAFFGTIAFSILFRAPKRHFITCGLIGTVVWLCYLGVNFLSGTDTVSIFLGALTAILLSRISAILHRTPVTIFLVAGIFPLVPGAGIYYTVYSAITENYNLAISYFLSAFKNAFAIAIAISLGVIIPTKYFKRILLHTSASSEHTNTSSEKGGTTG